MAIEKIVKIILDIGDSAKEVSKITKEFEELDKQAAETTENINKDLEEVDKTSKKSGKGFKGLSSNVKGLGLAFGAFIGGAIVVFFTKLSKAILENEKVAKELAKVSETISIFFEQLASALVDSFIAIKDNTDGFDALLKVSLNLIKFAINPIRLGFLSIKQVITAAQLAWEKSFFGDGDEGRIKELNNDLKENDKAIVELAKSTLNAGKEIVNNFGEAIDEVGQLGETVFNNISNISIESARKQKKASEERKKAIEASIKASEIALAKQKALIAELSIQESKLKEIRDNELLSIEERKVASDALLSIINEQEKAIIRESDIIINAAKARGDYVEVLESEANKKRALSTIEEKRLSQIKSDINLQKERIKINQTRIEGDVERDLKQKRFEASQEEDTLKRLEKERQVLEQEREIERERLQAKVDSFNAGTQARIDAENELKDRLLEIDQEIAQNKKETADKTKEIDQTVLDAKLAIQNAELDNIAKGIGIAKGLFEKNKALQAAAVVAENAVGVARILINTQAANAKVGAKYSGIPGGLALAAAEISANKVNAALGIAASLKATLKATGILGKSGGATGGQSVPSGGSGGVQEPPAPAFNLIGQAGGVNQIEEGLQQEQTPIQAFVVSGDVSSAQELDRNIIDSATIG